MSSQKKSANKADKLNKVLTIVGIVLCVILIPILIVNCTLIVKNLINKDEAPDFAGVVPLIVLTDSMYPQIESGDLIFAKKVDTDDIKVGDVISFYAEEDDFAAIWTHEVIEIIEEDGMRKFRTQGTNNPTPDGKLRNEDKIVGVYSDFKLSGAGNIAMELQKPSGFIICVIVPIILFVGYDVVRRRISSKEATEDVDALRAELEALKAEKAKSQSDVEDSENK